MKSFSIYHSHHIRRKRDMTPLERALPLPMIFAFAPLAITFPYGFLYLSLFGLMSRAKLVAEVYEEEDFERSL